MTQATELSKIIDHLFRHESGKMVSVLTKILGTANIDLAEDVVQDAMVEAINQWTYKGVPDNPTGWLYNVAKYKAINFINREKLKHKYSSEAIYLLQSEWTAEPAINHFFSEQEIEDDQLRMMFTCCHPSLSPDSQIALTLKTLCGFSIPEIAKAFLTNDETINKRLVRARKKIRDNEIPFEIPKGHELEKRLQTILETTYLLFNEGYSASKGNDIIRYELCEEAIRLAYIIINSKALQQKGNVFALLSLMYLNASRFKARQDNKGNLLTMEEQNRSLWDKRMIDIGINYLNEATKNGEVGVYHSLAAISSHHSIAENFNATNWKAILAFYNHLALLDNSPLILLNRSVAVLKVHGAESAIIELEKIENLPSLQNYHLLFSTKAEFYLQSYQHDKAAEYLKKAIRLSNQKAEKALLEKKLHMCTQK